jgi:hypothetical protein
MMATFRVRFNDYSNRPSEVVTADSFEFPDEGWGHVLFYDLAAPGHRGVVTSFLMTEVFSIAREPDNA